MAGNSKNFLPAYKVISGADASANITSSVTDIRYLDNICYQVAWTGTPTGTLTVQGSLDYALGSGATVLNAGTWHTIPLSGLTNPAGSASDELIFLTQISVPFIRLIYTAVSGAGSMTAYISGKAV